MKFEQLMAAVIHDIKNQLQTLLDYENEALAQVPEQYHKHIQPILQRTIRLKNDTLQMMILFGIEDNNDFPYDDAWPKDSVSHAIDEVQILFPNISFINSIDDNCQGVYNEQLVQLALVTIITNSIQAGAAEIIVSADNSEGLVIHIEDNGHGFSQDILSGAKQTTKQDGSGLGLYFVRLIAEHHKQGDKQGRIEYANRPKKNGARVSIYLP